MTAQAHLQTVNTTYKQNVTVTGLTVTEHAIVADHCRAWKLKEGHPTCDLLTHSEIQDAVDQVNAEQQRANATAIPEQAIVNFQV